MEINQLTEYEKEILISHDGLIKTIVNKYLPKFQYCYDDMMQVGYMGLIKAIRAYDRLSENETVCAFSTIAYRYIQTEISTYLKKYEYTPFTVSRESYQNALKGVVLSINIASNDADIVPFEISEEILSDSKSMREFEDVENKIYAKQVVDKIKKIIGEKDYKFLISTFGDDTNADSLLSRSGKEMSRQYKFKKKTQLIQKLKDRLNEFNI